MWCSGWQQLCGACAASPLTPSLNLARRLLDRLAGRALRLLACAVKTDLGDLADYDGSERHRGGWLMMCFGVLP